MNYDPNNPKNFFNPDKCSVKQKILRGGWLCNFNPQQTMNNVLCRRNFFFNGYSPCQYTCIVNNESKMRFSSYNNKYICK